MLRRRSITTGQLKWAVDDLVGNKNLAETTGRRKKIYNDFLCLTNLFLSGD